MIDIENLYKEIGKGLYSYIYRLSGDRSVTEDVVQETFYRAMERLLLADKMLNKAWFYKVARNIYFDQVRVQNRIVLEAEATSMPDAVTSPSEEYLVKKQEIKNVKYLLSQMTENYRAVLTLREYEELSYEEIGKRLNMNTSQVKITLFRARACFKKLYERSFNDEM